MEKDELIRLTAQTAASHIGRAREGKRLLAEGKSLSEMKTPQVGLEEDQLRKRREEYLDSLATKSKADLTKMLEFVEERIDHARNTELQGTSELYWQRIALRDKLGLDF